MLAAFFTLKQQIKAQQEGFADGGYHAGGYRVVGERGVEMEYTGPSTIISNSDTRKSLGTDELIAEVKKLREETNENTFAVADSQKQMLNFLRQWDGNGLPSDRGY